MALKQVLEQNAKGNSKIDAAGVISSESSDWMPAMTFRDADGAGAKSASGKEVGKPNKKAEVKKVEAKKVEAKKVEEEWVPDIGFRDASGTGERKASATKSVKAQISLEDLNLQI